MLREFNQPRGPIVTADGASSPSRVPTPAGSAVQVPARVPDRRPVRRRHRLLHVRLRLDAARAHPERRAHRATPPSSSCAASPTCSTRQRQHRHRAADDARRPPAGRQGRARRPRGLGRRDGPDDRRGAGDVQQPELRPQPGRQRTTSTQAERRARRSSTPRPASRCWPTPTRSATCRARRSRCITTGIGLENGVIDLDSQFPNETEWVPPQTNDPIENYNGSVRRRPGRGVRPQLQHPVRPDGARHRAPTDGRRHRRRGASARRSRSTCPRPAASTFGNVDDLDRQPAAARPSAASARATTRWCRCTWRWSPPPSPTAAR